MFAHANMVTASRCPLQRLVRRHARQHMTLARSNDADTLRPSEAAEQVDDAASLQHNRPVRRRTKPWTGSGDLTRVRSLARPTARPSSLDEGGPRDGNAWSLRSVNATGSGNSESSAGRTERVEEHNLGCERLDARCCRVGDTDGLPQVLALGSRGRSRAA
jgi:hypothetical protein